jgi:hypothetical protein
MSKQDIFLIAIVGIALFALIVFIGKVASEPTPAETEYTKGSRESVQLCKDKGGIPNYSTWNGAYEKCEMITQPNNTTEDE